MEHCQRMQRPEHLQHGQQNSAESGSLKCIAFWITSRHFRLPTKPQILPHEFEENCLGPQILCLVGSGKNIMQFSGILAVPAVSIAE